MRRAGFSRASLTECSMAQNCQTTAPDEKQKLGSWAGGDVVKELILDLAAD